MEHKIFINLAIQDLSRFMDFYTQLDFLDPDRHHWEIFFMDMDKFMA